MAEALLDIQTCSTYFIPSKDDSSITVISYNQMLDNINYLDDWHDKKTIKKIWVWPICSSIIAM